VAAFYLASAGPWCALRPAQAQGRNGGRESGDGELTRLVEAVIGLMYGAAERSHEKVLEFLETVELFDAGAEIDRLAGDPRELNDSTAYKLSLLPLHIRFPIYKQLVQQMTRQDDLRSRRIQNVKPDSVGLVVLRLDSWPRTTSWTRSAARCSPTSTAGRSSTWASSCWPSRASSRTRRRAGRRSSGASPRRARRWPPPCC
jgi:hypothetical protein